MAPQFHPQPASTENSGPTGFLTLPGRILVVEDDPIERRALTLMLKTDGHNVAAADSVEKALGYADEGIELVISDLLLGGSSGLDLLQLWKARNPHTHFILLTGQGSIDSAVEAMKRGAFDYVTKPVNRDELRVLVRRAIISLQKDRQIENLQRRLDERFGLHQIIGQSPQMRDVFERIRRAAAVDSTVLILGESGTGKELVAQALHHNGLRRSGPFVAVNCAAVPATLVESELFGHVRGAFTGATERRIGRFEQASGGTLFIDEIGDFELGLQAKLLRVLETLLVTPVGGHEDRRVDVRVIAATSHDLTQMMSRGTFRQDLFYRLNVVQVLLPPLRQRVQDIPLLVEHFLQEISQHKRTGTRRISPALMDRLLAYPWPGNVRELRNTLESMMVLAEGEVLDLHDLPDRLLEPARFQPELGMEQRVDMTIEQLERRAISLAMERFKGNRTHAAMTLGISLRTLQRKLHQYEMERRMRASDAVTEA